MTRLERLQNWINKLDNEQKNRILLELVDFAIDTGYVNFWEDSEAPYFDATGDRLDEI